MRVTITLSADDKKDAIEKAKRHIKEKFKKVVRKPKVELLEDGRYKIVVNIK